MAKTKPVRKSAQKPKTRAKKTTRSVKTKKRGKSLASTTKKPKKVASRSSSKNIFEKTLPKNIEKLRAEMISGIDELEKTELVKKLEELLEKFEIYLLSKGKKIAKKGQTMAKKAHKIAKGTLKKKSVKRAPKKKRTSKAKT